ncbi:MAG: hypothetical protein C0594_11750 [Marinilabiliales bacterium]|nr:MAG: hypothetical protein C0594_11750 [Marinilabiliales bacterium]
MADTKDIFLTEKIVWFGLDFSRAKMIGQTGFNNPVDIVNRLFSNWNNIILLEEKKYNLIKFLGKSKIVYDFSVVTRRNKLVQPKELVINTDHKISSEDLTTIINDYKSEEYSEGIGLSFIIESFNKFNNQSYLYVCFFDIESRSILLAAYMHGKARGFGIRNFWANSIHDILTQIGTKKLKKWEKSCIK